MTKNARFANTVVDVSKGHFTCPLCRKIGNIFMPHVNHPHHNTKSKQVHGSLLSDSEWMQMVTSSARNDGRIHEMVDNGHASAVGSEWDL